MQRKSCEEEIYKLWLQWPDAKDKFGTNFGLHFFSWLEKNHSDLLSFRDKDDKYQTINMWVEHWKRKHKI